MFNLFGQQRGAIEFDHLQAAMHLMHTTQALSDRGRVLRVGDKRFKGLTGLFQRFGNLALDPFEGHVVVPISHDNSKCLLIPKQPTTPCRSQLVGEKA